MKRTIIERDFDSLSMANCLMSLSHRKEYYDPIDDSISSRVFECKTCNRQFSSFQALGGHRASHKKPKLTTVGEETSLPSSTPTKPKTHECSICGLEFAIGQALGGHMRRHRAAAAAMNDSHTTPTPPPPLDLLPSHHQLPVVKKSNSTRVLCLDLNLTPMENVLEFRLGKPIYTGNQLLSLEKLQGFV